MSNFVAMLWRVYLRLRMIASLQAIIFLIIATHVSVAAAQDSVALQGSSRDSSAADSWRAPLFVDRLPSTSLHTLSTTISVVAIEGGRVLWVNGFAGKIMMIIDTGTARQLIDKADSLPIPSFVYGSDHPSQMLRVRSDAAGEMIGLTRIRLKRGKDPEDEYLLFFGDSAWTDTVRLNAGQSNRLFSMLSLSPIAPEPALVEPWDPDSVVGLSDSATARDAKRSPADTANKVGTKSDSSSLTTPGAIKIEVRMHDNPKPIFPDRLRQARDSGKVVMKFIVDKDGYAIPASIKVLQSSHPLFSIAVREALSHSRFHPATIDGRKVNELVKQTFVFNIRD